MDTGKLPVPWNYPLSMVPAWCDMPATDHLDGMGGCWSISHGLVRNRGEANCTGCEYYRRDADPCIVVQ
jgi:hypothetical protein